MYTKTKTFSMIMLEMKSHSKHFRILRYFSQLISLFLKRQMRAESVSSCLLVCIFCCCCKQLSNIRNLSWKFCWVKQSAFWLYSWLFSVYNSKARASLLNKSFLRCEYFFVIWMSYFILYFSFPLSKALAWIAIMLSQHRLQLFSFQFELLTPRIITTHWLYFVHIQRNVVWSFWAFVTFRN
jgi:hypothetical protein